MQTKYVPLCANVIKVWPLSTYIHITLKFLQLVILRFFFFTLKVTTYVPKSLQNFLADRVVEKMQQSFWLPWIFQMERHTDVTTVLHPSLKRTSNHPILCYDVKEKKASHSSLTLTLQIITIIFLVKNRMVKKSDKVRFTLHIGMTSYLNFIILRFHNYVLIKGVLKFRKTI